MLKGKKIALGVTGGIAAYKAVALTSKLTQAGADVRVIMTDAATKLITPLTFKEISGNPVAVDMWSGNAEFHVEHIAMVKWADLFVVAPATANIIGKMAHGIADDLLSTTLLACNKPIIICPAMNTVMLEQPIVQKNLQWLASTGVQIMEPGSGNLACGTSGKGRLPEPEEILAYVDNFLAAREGDLKGLTVLVTAGGTREAIDPVRFIGNRSTGKMGYAIAKDALARGARVILISAPSALTPPYGVEFVPVVSTNEMLQAVLKYYDDVDIVIKAAAVCDFKPEMAADSKIKKQADEKLVLELVQNPDILQQLGQKKTHQIPGRLCRRNQQSGG
jgi:phosphopantothenoylcysteine decarboxylase/phosphopantothenate--cysteine ligase